ncbi:unnamed protein product [Leuciscus chuanchicus]
MRTSVSGNKDGCHGGALPRCFMSPRALLADPDYSMVQAQDGLAGWLVKSIPQGFLRSLWLNEREQPEGIVSGRPEPEAVPWSPATHSASCQRAKRENKCSAIL